MKICTTCFIEKDDSEFYESMGGNKCKVCVRAAVKANRESKREQYSKYEAERNKSPERKKKAADYQRNRRAKNPLKNSARQAVMWAVRNGWLIPQPCEVCGTKVGIEAHHDDYEKALEVRWFCFAHHRSHGHGQTVVSEAVGKRVVK